MYLGRTIALFGFGIFVCMNIGCIEPFDAEFVDFESALVVEASITNELGPQRIFLTRTFEFDADGPSAESNAQILVTDNMGNSIDFSEVSPGVYESEEAFAAQAGVEYQLWITTEDNRSYSSTNVSFVQNTQIDNLEAVRITNDDGIDGINILIDSFDPTGNSVNYRYTYEETYRIIAPSWVPADLVADPDSRCGMIVVPKQREERICYATDLSNTIIQTSTEKLNEDRVDDFVVRFLNRDNYIISHRYSILVRQFVQSNEAFTFYQTLDEFSSNESLFSETQPGFLEGNVSSTINPNERVLGYFEVSPVDSRRIFFDYVDFYPDEPLPPYVNACRETAPPIIGVGSSECILRRIIENNLARYRTDNESPAEGEGPFFIVPRVCGDCTVLGEIEVPDFWVD